MTKFTNLDSKTVILRHIHDYLTSSKVLREGISIAVNRLTTLENPQGLPKDLSPLQMAKRQVAHLTPCMSTFTYRESHDQPKTFMIACIGSDGLIGYNNELPWANGKGLKNDLKRFRERTMGSVVIMGANTAASIGRPLKGRINMVVSRDPQKHWPDQWSVPEERRWFWYTSIDQAVEVAKELSSVVFLIGGASIYEWGLENADGAYISQLRRTISNFATTSGTKVYMPGGWHKEVPGGWTKKISRIVSEAPGGSVFYDDNYYEREEI